MPPFPSISSILTSFLLLLTSLNLVTSTPIQRLTKREPHVDVLSGANFPDSTLIAVDNITYVFGTDDGVGHQVPLTSNPDFEDPSGWSAISDAFPSEGVPAFGDGGWAVKGSLWAPDVVRLVSLLFMRIERQRVEF
jgi:hypothetical protein